MKKLEKELKYLEWKLGHIIIRDFEVDRELRPSIEARIAELRAANIEWRRVK